MVKHLKERRPLPPQRWDDSPAAVAACGTCEGSGCCMACGGEPYDETTQTYCRWCWRSGNCRRCGGSGRAADVAARWRVGWLHRRWRWYRGVLHKHHHGRASARWPLRLLERWREYDCEPYPTPYHNTYGRHVPKWAKVRNRDRIFSTLLDRYTVLVLGGRWARAGGLVAPYWPADRARRRPRW